MSDGRMLFQRYIDDLWNGDDLDVADELFAQDHRYHDPYFPALPEGPDGVKVRARAYKLVFSGRVEPRDWVVQDDRVACYWVFRGTNIGPVGDVAPTGMDVTIPGKHLVHVRDGRIAESWVSWDRLGAFEQLGLVLMEPPQELPDIP